MRKTNLRPDRPLLALLWLCRWGVALTFIFSGFVKVADPMGMAHKLRAYALAASLPQAIASSDLLPEVAAAALGCLEFVLGMQLLLGVRRRLSALTAAVLMAAFTALTAWNYLTHAVPDCGCFGDALTLTGGQTLAKNVALLAAALLLWLLPVRMRRFISVRHAWVVSIYAWAYAITLSLLTLHTLPALDFTPYRRGADIRAALAGEGDAQAQAARLANFYLEDPATGNDLSFDIAADTGLTFILAVPDALAADDGCSDRINDIYDACTDRGYRFYMATASAPEAVSVWRDRTGAAYPVLQAEDTELQAMVRSNPGLLLIRDGRVAAKWSNNNLPDPDTQGTDVAAWTEDDTVPPLLRLILWFVIPAVLVVVADSLWIGTKYYKHHIFIKRFNSYKAMRKKIVAGNWKMNMNLQDGIALATELNGVLAADKPNCGVIICTPFIHLASVAGIIDSNVIGLGAENCADKAKGAYTGEVSAEMVKSTGAQYVILGHSERRAYYHETPEILKEKVNLALENGLDVIFCIGEVLEDREAGKQNEVVKAQLEGSLFDLTAEQFSHIILAYEPVWAIGTGKTATADQAQDMHAFIRSTIAAKFGAEAAENVSILYGGSCKPSNAKEIFSKTDVDGGLIGGAALKAADFKGIIDAWKA